MKRNFYALEDDSLVIMLYELWCKKFNLRFILCKDLKSVLTALSNENIDICAADYSMLELSNEQVANSLTIIAGSSKLFITTGYTDQKTCYGFPIFSKTDVLEKLENEMAGFRGTTSNPGFGSISL